MQRRHDPGVDALGAVELGRRHDQVGAAGLGEVVEPAEVGDPDAEQVVFAAQVAALAGELEQQVERAGAVVEVLVPVVSYSWTVWNSVAGSEAAGGMWRAEYLRLTYGCGAYVPYEQLVRTAARTAGLPATAADTLDERWVELAAWSGAQEALDALQGRTKLAVVTNCSERLGLLAAGRLNIPWDCVVAGRPAGYYKPDPRPYRLALARIDVSAAEAAFVAGSGYDLFGARAVGLRTYWHNRVGSSVPTVPRRRISSADPRPIDSPGWRDVCHEFETPDSRLDRSASPPWPWCPEASRPRS